jgi:hypothetical protein
MADKCMGLLHCCLNARVQAYAAPNQGRALLFGLQELRLMPQHHQHGQGLGGTVLDPAWQANEAEMLCSSSDNSHPPRLAHMQVLNQ